VTEPQRGQTTHKFVVVLSKKIPPAAALNACAHMTATLVARADDQTKGHMSFVDYADADGNAHPVSALSLVVLSAKNSSQLRTARLDAIRAGLSHTDFTATMTQDTAELRRRLPAAVSRHPQDSAGGRPTRSRSVRCLRARRRVG
jgi:hypothetical protein